MKRIHIWLLSHYWLLEFHYCASIYNTSFRDIQTFGHLANVKVES